MIVSRPRRRSEMCTRSRVSRQSLIDGAAWCARTQYVPHTDVRVSCSVYRQNRFLCAHQYSIVLFPHACLQTRGQDRQNMTPRRTPVRQAPRTRTPTGTSQGRKHRLTSTAPPPLRPWPRMLRCLRRPGDAWWRRGLPRCCRASCSLRWPPPCGLRAGSLGCPGGRGASAT
jgi:hypothetical protein